ncbi:MAG TPA: TetR/AcrR family transcriptional regulator [Acidimicrobiales bacterium]|nr:TetR/AcrR family transcriptional regulator [Acidimicrobiales bacterium]
MAAEPLDSEPVDDPRAAARERIVRGARAGLAERGLAVRVEDVAAAAGLSRRTVFRYFETRESLLVAALQDSMRSYGKNVPRPGPDVELEEWLRAALVAVHRMNAQHGRVYFELASGVELQGELGDLARARRAARAELVHRFTDTAWRLAGGTSDPPPWLHDAVAVSLSAFATEALGPDFGRAPEEVGESLAPALAHAVRGAVAEAGRGADPGHTLGTSGSRIRSRRRRSS